LHFDGTFRRLNLKVVDEAHHEICSRNPT
jgi:hypothetical protein